jgi:hypothetical protein
MRFDGSVFDFYSKYLTVNLVVLQVFFKIEARIGIIHEVVAM